jgi:eukaryotic-like serine/threonine-protein kinase
MSADRNLLFGMLALQMDFISREQLIDAMHAWMLRKQTPLGDILCEKNVLCGEDRRTLDGLVNRLVRQHGDAAKSLAALRVEPAARREL